MPLIVVFSVAMLGKEYQENLARGMGVTEARSAEYLSTIQVTLFAVFYGLAIARILKRDSAEHMRYMICLALINLCLVSLIVFDRRRKFPETQ
jgi:hypothetical protein